MRNPVVNKATRVEIYTDTKLYIALATSAIRSATESATPVATRSATLLATSAPLPPVTERATENALMRAVDDYRYLMPL